MRYQISSLELLKQMLAELDDNPLHPWDAYPCLIWPRSNIGGDGYCRIHIGGGKEVLVHRLSFELAVGPIPPHCDCCHHCDNPPCFRPIHLFTGTRSDNINDCFAKGRRVILKGEANNKAKLTAEQVLEIRALSDQGFTNAEIGRRLNYSLSGVSRILRGVLWRCV